MTPIISLVAGVALVAPVTPEQRAVLEHPQASARWVLPPVAVFGACTDALRSDAPLTPAQRRTALGARAEAYFQIGYPDLGVTDADECARLDPADARAAGAAARLRYVRTGDIAVVRDFLKRHPGDPWGKVALADYALRAEPRDPKATLALAEDARKAALEDTPELAFALLVLAEARYAAGDYPGADAAADECAARSDLVSRTHNPGRLYTLRAKVRLLQGRYAGAEAAADLAWRFMPAAPDGLLLLWHSQIGLGRPDGAYLLARKFRDAFPADKQGPHMLAASCNLTGRWADALAVPDDPVARWLLAQKAVAHLAAGDDAKALATATAAIKAETEPVALGAYMLVTTLAGTADPSVGRVTSVQLAPGSTRSSLLLAAVVHARDERFEAAEKAVDELLKRPQFGPRYTADLKRMKAAYAKGETVRPVDAIAAVTATNLPD